MAQLVERVVVNCTGYGAERLFDDQTVEPLKGLLVLLKPQPGLNWLYSGNGYVFLRSDCVVVGGSADVQDDEDKEPGRLADMRAVAKALFAGHPLPAAAFDGSIIRDKMGGADMATVADYTISRLKLQGVEALFGMPAAYCADIYEAADRAARFRTVVTASDLEAGYAADGYARVRGLSAVAVAYGVGTRSLVNAVTGAYVERSPVLVLNGGLSDERIRRQTDKRILFSHSDGRAYGDLEMFRPVICFCERAAAALTVKRPAYVEIPTDFLSKAVAPPVRTLLPTPPAGAAAASAKAIMAALRAARPPLLAD